MRSIYLDYNATTPLAPAVQEAILPFLAEHYGCPSSRHVLGRAAREAVEDARARVAALIGADRREIVFTSGGTESNNLAIKGAVRRDAEHGGGGLVLSSLEHPSVRLSALALEPSGCSVAFVRCDARGIVDRNAVQAALSRNTAMVSIIHANHDFGVIQPIAEIARMCRARGVLVHTDASQSVGKIPVDVTQLGVDLLTISGHKMYAPKGIGALFVRRGVMLSPLLHGEAHEAGLRAGTENVCGIVALGMAATLAAETLPAHADRIAALRDRLEGRLVDEIPGASIHARHESRLPNTTSVNLPGTSAAEVLRRAPEICASAEPSCYGGASPLAEMAAVAGMAGFGARGALRLSLGIYTTEEEVDRAAELLIAAWENAAMGRGGG